MKAKTTITFTMVASLLCFPQTGYGKGFNMNDFGKAFSDGMAEKVMRRDELDSEVAIYSAKLKAQENMLERQYQNCREHNKYIASQEEVDYFGKKSRDLLNKANKEIEIQNNKFSKNKISQRELDDKVEKIKADYNQKEIALRDKASVYFNKKDAQFTAYCMRNNNDLNDKISANVDVDMVEMKHRRVNEQLEDQKRLQEEQENKIRRLEVELNDIKIKKCGGTSNC